MGKVKRKRRSRREPVTAYPVDPDRDIVSRINYICNISVAMKMLTERQSRVIKCMPAVPWNIPDGKAADIDRLCEKLRYVTADPLPSNASYVITDIKTTLRDIISFAQSRSLEWYAGADDSPERARRAAVLIRILLRDRTADRCAPRNRMISEMSDAVRNSTVDEKLCMYMFDLLTAAFDGTETENDIMLMHAVFKYYAYRPAADAKHIISTLAAQDAKRMAITDFRKELETLDVDDYPRYDRMAGMMKYMLTMETITRTMEYVRTGEDWQTIVGCFPADIRKIL